MAMERRSLAMLPLGLFAILLGQLSSWCFAGIGRLPSRRGLPLCSVAVSEVTTEVRGKEGSESYRRYFFAKDQEISPWHDLPLSSEVEGEYFMVTEIPKNTKPKMEIATKESMNPIAQDTKKGKLREYHGPIYWNYGYLPQTWEDPQAEHPELKVKGDNDPVDVVEIGSRAHEQGEIVKVKDWKILAIATDDPMAAELSSLKDVETKLPGYISGIREWFRWYKLPDGKPLNSFGFGEQPLDAPEAIKVIEETHGFWKKLREKGDSNLWVG
ncbi:unnamed protein product [Durusdinium trenchii]|uniref:inorganic diphosphatase n=1 Tax=Durusdinium trenchii TaxID=1381693 RepID=A0ABP0J194_9DINO